MRHPFAGISIPQSTDSKTTSHSTQFLPSRRAVVQGMLGGLSLAALPWEAAADDQARPGAQAQPPATHDRYLVIPADYRKFTAARRKELNVLGNFFSPAHRSRDQWRTAGGFLAWLTPAEAEVLKSAADVARVERLTADDIPTPQEGARQGEQHILVRLLPGDWKMQPKRGTYQSADEILKAWQKQFKDQDGVEVAQGPQESMLVLAVGNQELPQKVLAAIKEHPQVVGLQWMAAAAPKPGNGATTEAMGEEGAATTLALNEEGGKPSTTALGEEGGPIPSTRALGEEWGVPQQATTYALGEEGGPKPPRPGGVTTYALGEEGTGRPGGVTTYALGEEGGPRPSRPTRPTRPGGGVTTYALGEEGR